MTVIMPSFFMVFDSCYHGRMIALERESYLFEALVCLMPRAPHGPLAHVRHALTRVV